jgi:hypothetical protein
MSRLHGIVNKGDDEAKVGAGLSWEEGDKLFFAPTAMQHDHRDYLTTKSYNNDTGALELEGNFEHYHYGASEVKPDEFAGVDMRGEVILLTRNVQIIGEDTDGWGGQILTAELRDPKDSKKFLGGQLHLHNVEIFNCSQENVHAAVRFEGAITGPSVIKNSVVHGSLHQAMYIQSSNKITVTGSSFVGAHALGINIAASSEVKLDQVFVGDIQRRRDISNLDGALDIEACFAFCSTDNSKCPGS